MSTYLRLNELSNARDAGFQTTADHSLGAVIVEGRGLHTGKLFRLNISRAKRAGQGILFRHLRDGVEFSAPASWLRVSGTSRATALILRGEARRRFELFTVEHLLSASLVSGHHDLDIAIETPEGSTEALEMPNLDGSAYEWFQALMKLPPLKPSAAERGEVFWKVIRSLEVVDGKKRVIFSPLTENALTRYHCAVDFGGAWKQNAFFEIDWRDLDRARAVYAKEIAPARTFGFKAELEALEKRGLALGASLANAILLDGDHVVNEGGLRIPNELAAHKLMDAIGDLHLLGAPFLGRVDLNEAGHSMHLRAVEEAYRTGALVKGHLLASGVFEPIS